MGSSELSKFKIKLPKNKKLIDDLIPMFQEIDEHQQAVKGADELYKKYIHELRFTLHKGTQLQYSRK